MMPKKKDKYLKQCAIFNSKRYIFILYPMFVQKFASMNKKTSVYSKHQNISETIVTDVQTQSIRIWFSNEKLKKKPHNFQIRKLIWIYNYLYSFHPFVHAGVTSVICHYLHRTGLLVWRFGKIFHCMEQWITTVDVTIAKRREYFH